MKKLLNAWKWFADGLTFGFDYYLDRDSFNIGFSFDRAFYDEEDDEYYPAQFNLNLGFLTLLVYSKT